MHLEILSAGIENGGHWLWPSRLFGHFDSRNSINVALVHWSRPAKGCCMTQRCSCMLLLPFLSCGIVWKNKQKNNNTNLCKTVVTPIHYQWSYFSFAFSHCYHLLALKQLRMLILTVPEYKSRACTVITRAPSQYRRFFPGMVIPMLKIGWPWDCLIFNMGIPILVKRHF